MANEKVSEFVKYVGRLAKSDQKLGPAEYEFFTDRPVDTDELAWLELRERIIVLRHSEAFRLLGSPLGAKLRPMSKDYGDFMNSSALLRVVAFLDLKLAEHLDLAQPDALPLQQKLDKVFSGKRLKQLHGLRLSRNARAHKIDVPTTEAKVDEATNLVHEALSKLGSYGPAISFGANLDFIHTAKSMSREGQESFECREFSLTLVNDGRNHLRVTWQLGFFDPR